MWLRALHFPPLCNSIQETSPAVRVYIDLGGSSNSSFHPLQGYFAVLKVLTHLVKVSREDKKVSFS